MPTFSEDEKRRHPFRVFMARWGPLGAILLFIVIGGGLIQNAVDVSNKNFQRASNHADDLLRGNQLAACLRGNRLRREINARVVAQGLVVEALSGFMRDAIAVRVRSARRDPANRRDDLRAVADYRHDLGLLHTAMFKPISIPDCEAVVKRP